jgi:hypothetical protein
VLTDHDGQEHRLAHSWNEAPDGQLVDSTAWAFEDQVLPYRYERDPQAWVRAGRLEDERGQIGVSVRKLSPAANERAVGDQWA